jgi:peptidylprolyl isomerase
MTTPRILLFLILLFAASLSAGCSSPALSPQGEGPAAQAGDTVRVHYTCTLANGAVVESKVDGDPVELILGSGGMPARVEANLVGMRPQETTIVVIPPSELWGDEVFTLEKEKLLTAGELSVGQNLSYATYGGNVVEVTVIEISDETATVQNHHELAGVSLTYYVQLVEIIQDTL